MNTEQKLTKIREKCVELLAIAEKRTPGKWNPFKNWVTCGAADIAKTSTAKKEHDAAFIASCAGHAEACWKATICAIDYLMNYASDQLEEEEAREEIIAAWEGLV